MAKSSLSITLSLISHTNIGKTTLARTLLRQEVGQVRDQAHVTLQNEVFVLLKTSDGQELILWDTPGFGNSHKLLQRLQGLSNPIGWLTSQIWDRMADKPFWCTQQAIRNVRDDADIVLYLVNATEDPAMAGYLQPELDLLTWLHKPVIVLLNQTGLVDPAYQHQLESCWKNQWSSYEIIRDVMSLDAFTRCWVQEGLLWDRITHILPVNQQSNMARISQAWYSEQQRTLNDSMRSIANLLIETAQDSETLSDESSRPSKSRHLKIAIQAMDQRLTHRISSANTQLINLHGLSGQTAHMIQARMEDFVVPGERQPWEEESFWGGLVSGAAAGFASDVATGGLSHGIFTLGGAILGALGGTAYAKTQDQGDPNKIWWVSEYLNRQTRDALLRYLAIIHSGRGKGEYTDPREFPLFWQEETQRQLNHHSRQLENHWEECKTVNEANGGQESIETLVQLLTEITFEILLTFYPEAQSWLQRNLRPE